ncbi:MAG: NAD(P)H-quinone dehydrogenase [Candidatus Nanopelagicales bacterium]|nr:NAD(P)H-quinone dehydrogenase [Candidatus Nanopelagicales bacterium]MDP4907050.1 NAD(P)H-quinone dehydrogenase [Candidatus Nanopelagicales bacterium]MDP4974267.1 NAD(P)H-quinone dehydrogenase [Candidatus Nanopelagicales bacterium]MDP5095307.1 NAD(P)H-quinone dehydrogenase [Candidatus Nanopelagicales bacterium]
MASVVIMGAGPGGYEAALVGAQLGARVTIVDTDGPGGSAVLTDCVPSKTLIATADLLAVATEAGSLGIRVHGEVPTAGTLSVDLGAINSRVKELASAQSRDIAERLTREGIRYLRGRGRLLSSTRVAAATEAGEEIIEADVVLLATGASPRVLASAQPDGERILTWDQVYDLDEVPRRLIVVGSGVTGAEFASAYHALGAEVVLVSSRDRVLPGEDPDAAAVIEEAFADRGMTVLSHARAASVNRTDEGVLVTLADGSIIEGSHALLAVGSVPNTAGLGLDEAGVECDERGFIVVDRVSRTTARGVYAAGDCTGVLMLASVAAMQGRIAMWHALGDSVSPLDRGVVSSTVFTTPEIATVGVTQQEVDAGDVRVDTVLLPLHTNARAKMLDIRRGFVKLFCRRTSRIIVGGVVVGPRASELIHPITVAVEARLTVDQLASTFTVYPSLSGSIAEAARRLHRPENE